MSSRLDTVTCIAGINSRLRIVDTLKLRAWMKGEKPFHSYWVDNAEITFLPELVFPLFQYIYTIHADKPEGHRLFLYREALQLISKTLSVDGQKDLHQWILDFNNSHTLPC